MTEEQSQVEVAVVASSSPEIFRTARSKAEKDRIQQLTIEEVRWKVRWGEWAGGNGRDA